VFRWNLFQRQLRSLNLPMNGKPAYGCRHSDLSDPEGNQVELVCYDGSV